MSLLWGSYPRAHQIDVEHCSECPFALRYEGGDECDHPVIEETAIVPGFGSADPPPDWCPLRGRRNGGGRSARRGRVVRPRGWPWCARCDTQPHYVEPVDPRLVSAAAARKWQLVDWDATDPDGLVRHCNEDSGLVFEVEA